eukprot:scaffold6918_cov380-Prasinococcus_capsulatus_cf.AAC.9
MSVTIAATCSSRREPPPPRIAPGLMRWMLSRMTVASCIWKAMSALGCWPKASGLSTAGRPAMYSLQLASDEPDSGM